MKILIITLSFICFSNLYAKGGPPEGFSLGAGYIYSTPIYTGEESTHLPMPFFSYLKGNLAIRGLAVSYTVIRNDIFRVSLLLDPKFFSGGYEADDSLALTGMDERKGSVTAGGNIGLNLGPLKLGSKIVKDILGVHGGVEADISLGADFPISVLFKSMPFTMIGASFGYNYFDESYNNYYYGVKSTEATASRPAYTTSSSMSPWLSSFLRIQLGASWTLMSIYKLEWLPDEVKNSPIVDKKKKSSVIVFLNYKF